VKITTVSLTNDDDKYIALQQIPYVEGMRDSFKTTISATPATVVAGSSAEKTRQNDYPRDYSDSSRETFP